MTKLSNDWTDGGGHLKYVEIASLLKIVFFKTIYSVLSLSLSLSLFLYLFAFIHQESLHHNNLVVKRAGVGKGREGEMREERERKEGRKKGRVQKGGGGK